MHELSRPLLLTHIHNRERERERERSRERTIGTHTHTHTRRGAGKRHGTSWPNGHTYKIEWTETAMYSRSVWVHLLLRR